MKLLLSCIAVGLFLGWYIHLCERTYEKTVQRLDPCYNTECHVN